MLAYERKSRIIEYLEQHGKAEVNTLSKMLGVVAETIRRDMRELEAQGVLKRTHGGAVAVNQKEREYPVQVRVMKNAVEKDRLCREAVGFINEGDMIFIDNSSTLVNLIKHLDDNMQLTILTNSIKVLQEYSMYRKENISMLCTGGVFNKANLSLSGAVSDKFTREFFPNKAFISCHGISDEYGFTDGNLHEVGLKREMISLAEKVYFLIDHTKFGKLGPIRLGGLEICDVLITDEKPSGDLIRQLKHSRPDMEIVVCED
ncbi:MAG: DeoR/GlpR transcriptional regulator [Clostridiaceae bacterium]|jgi:DeoR family fructose operon transcriptional repressor|nr:DeoR/GlpR transcriptional regulator [Clostridiaceae bacterium]